MKEEQRTNLLNYLNDEKIEYKFNKEDQTVIIDLTIKEE